MRTAFARYDFRSAVHVYLSLLKWNAFTILLVLHKDISSELLAQIWKRINDIGRQASKRSLRLKN